MYLELHIITTDELAATFDKRFYEYSAEFVINLSVHSSRLISLFFTTIAQMDALPSPDNLLPLNKILSYQKYHFLSLYHFFLFPYLSSLSYVCVHAGLLTLGHDWVWANLLTVNGRLDGWMNEVDRESHRDQIISHRKCPLAETNLL